MILYEKSFSQHKLIYAWFNRVGEIPEVKQIQEEWQKLTPALINTIKNVPIQQNSKL